jgi:hypothetical protein
MCILHRVRKNLIYSETATEIALDRVGFLSRDKLLFNANDLSVHFGIVLLIFVDSIIPCNH